MCKTKHVSAYFLGHHQVVQPDDGLKSRPKHVVVLHIVQNYSTIKFVVFRLTIIVYCVTLEHNRDVSP
jgi:hypothetical protein